MTTVHDAATDPITGRARLRQWIERSKLNQIETAEIIGMDKTALNHILTGKRRPSLDSAVDIERATGIPVEAWVPSGDGTSSLTASATHEPALIDKA